jgi:hypothetical protein
VLTARLLVSIRAVLSPEKLRPRDLLGVAAVDGGLSSEFRKSKGSWPAAAPGGAQRSRGSAGGRTPIFSPERAALQGDPHRRPRWRARGLVRRLPGAPGDRERAQRDPVRLTIRLGRGRCGYCYRGAMRSTGTGSLGAFASLWSLVSSAAPRCAARATHTASRKLTLARRPCVAEQRADLSDAQRPDQQLIDRGCDLPRGEHSVKVTPGQHSPTLDEEDLRHPRDGVRRQHSAQASSPAGVGSQLDARRGVDDDRSHASPARRGGPGYRRR